MEVVENRDQWQTSYDGRWLAHYQETGKFDWSLYPRPKNRMAPAGPGILVTESSTPTSPLRLLGELQAPLVREQSGLAGSRSAYARMT